MNLIRAYKGRRQFMIGAFATSTSALLSTKLAGRSEAATAAKKSGSASEGVTSAGLKGQFSNRYSHLLSPLKIGNTVLKNRMMHTRSLPHFLQGPESFPSEQVISQYATVAKTAAIVTCRTARPTGYVRPNFGDMAHMPIWDVNDPSVQNYFSQLSDAIHFYDAKASMGITINVPQGYGISNVVVPGRQPGSGGGKEIPIELLQKMIEETIAQIRIYQSLGFDAVNIYMSYRAHLLAHALSPVLNKRTDKYGGSVENRARLPLELFQAIKKAFGPDFLIDAQVSGEEPAGGFTIKDIIEYAKIWEGTLDILQLRAVDGDAAHPSGLNSQKEAPITLSYAKAIKDAGVKLVTAPVGGFQDPGLNDSFIADGRTDMVAMARAYICDSDYSTKIYEGRGEDVVPCIRCNDCHGLGMNGPWHSWCSVNPKVGIAHRVNRMISAPGISKKVAVIGGGPAGMKAAIVAAERGHKVTLYERNDFLGGQIKYTDYSDFKWPLKDFKNYLIRQVDKLGVEVHLKTRATPEMIKAGMYDVVVAATGAAPFIPDIPGANGDNVRAPIFVYGGEKTLGKNIVVIGGDQIGTETGIHLAKLGHNVTVLTTERQLATDANQIHFVSQLRAAFEELKNFSYVTQATVKSISSISVVYADAQGNEKTIPAENVVIYAGRMPRRDEAMTFFGSASRYFAVGDCNAPGIVRRHGEANVANAMRTAYAVASQV